MNNPTTSLASIQKDFPFESRLSLTLLIKFWEDLAKADTLSGEHARSLLARLREVPALSGPIELGDVDGGSFQVTRPAQPTNIGSQIAKAIYGQYDNAFAQEAK